MTESKIKTIEEVVEIIEKLKGEGKKIVQCHGCFDYIHFGHVKHFESAKKQGDILVVTVTPDCFVQKGPGRPFYNEELRLEFLAALESIDYVCLNKWETAIETIKLIKPNVYVKGKEVLNNKDIDGIKEGDKSISSLSAEEEVLKSIGGVLYLTDEITFSSSSLINQITSAIPDESKDYLNEFRKKHSAEEIINMLRTLKDIRVLIIGDSILDEYAYCRQMEKSGKEPLISYKFLNSEIHLGGVFAVANHVAGFSDNASVLTCLGSNSFEIVESSLDPLLERNIFIQTNYKTLIKKRYIDDYKLNKLFSIYSPDELRMEKSIEDKILKFLEKNLSRFDMIMISDFGHGMITPKILNYLCDSDKFLAINCQLNAGNLGYNFITKYKKANFVSINERELRLPFQEKESSVEVPTKKLSNQLNLNLINITIGKRGMMHYNNGNFVHSPSFTKEPIDTIGAGDAVFALTSLLAYKNVDPEILPFLGNCIGGLATRIMGNKRAVSPTELKKFVSYILK